MPFSFARPTTLAGFVLTVSCSDPTPPPPPPPMAARIEAVSASSQRGPVGEGANAAPAIRAVSGDGAPVAGVAISFVASGGSVVLPSTVTTDGSGIARTVSWQLASGRSEVLASAAGVAPVVFTAEGRPRGFNLVVRWLEPPSPDAQAAVSAAKAAIEAVIWEDLPDERVDATPVCRLNGIPAATIDEDIDDVLILARVGPIDGLGGVGAQGFPCLIRDPGTQTIVGFVRLDEAEFAVIGENLQREFVLHEMVHALGLVPGVINISTPGGFSRSCLKLPSAGAPNTLVQDSHFDCANAVAAFDRIGGARYTGKKVPLENGATRPLTGNTLNHHWRKTSFQSEVMTGWFIAGIKAPLSVVTVGALEDLDYGVAYAAAEPFQLDGVIATTSAAAPGVVVELGEPSLVPSPLIHRSVARKSPALRP